MFECVSTNDVAQRENLAVREFCNFCEYVKAGHNEQIRPARVARREQQHREESETAVDGPPGRRLRDRARGGATQE